MNLSELSNDWPKNSEVVVAVVVGVAAVVGVVVAVVVGVAVVVAVVVGISRQLLARGAARVRAHRYDVKETGGDGS